MNPFYQFTVKSFLAGVLIGLACVIYIACPIPYAGSFLFSLGLLTIIIKQYYLYTGKVGDWVPSTTLKLIYMFIVNGIACGITTYLFTLTRIDLHHINDVVQVKLSGTLLSSFILGIGCGAMMHIAYYNFKKERHPLYVIMPVMLFILAGFDHSVANCGFLAMAHHSMSGEDWIRLILVVLGNAVGAWIFTKILPDSVIEHGHDGDKKEEAKH